MKKIFVLPFLVFSMNVLSSQEFTDSISNTIPPLTKSQTDSIIRSISYNINIIANHEWPKAPLSGRYKMYQTENIYNLLKLDSATGYIEQVQWSLNDDEEMVVTINSSDLSYERKIGTFELYPTKNMYQFILLDTTNGRTWHVQWGTESNKRWIRRIY